MDEQRVPLRRSLEASSSFGLGDSVGAARALVAEKPPTNVSQDGSGAARGEAR